MWVGDVYAYPHPVPLPRGEGEVNAAMGAALDAGSRSARAERTKPGMDSGLGTGYRLLKPLKK